MEEKELLAIFGSVYDEERVLFNTLNINGSVFKPLMYHATSRFSTQEINNITLDLQLVASKSPQEIAAEEAVRKLEIALVAAKDVLKTVKEK